MKAKPNEKKDQGNRTPAPESDADALDRMLRHNPSIAETHEIATGPDGKAFLRLRTDVQPKAAAKQERKGAANVKKDSRGRITNKISRDLKEGVGRVGGQGRRKDRTNPAIKETGERHDGSLGKG